MTVMSTRDFKVGCGMHLEAFQNCPCRYLGLELLSQTSIALKSAIEVCH